MHLNAQMSTIILDFFTIACNWFVSTEDFFFSLAFLVQYFTISNVTFEIVFLLERIMLPDLCIVLKIGDHEKIYAFLALEKNIVIFSIEKKKHNSIYFQYVSTV